MENDYKSGYEIGDRVIGISNINPWGVKSILNIEGAIVDFYENEAPHIGVRFDEFINGHDCGGKCEIGYGWYVHPEEIKSNEMLF